MKKISAFLLLLSIFACKKHDTRQIRTDLAGTWELEFISGYPFTQTVQPPGNGNLLILTTDGSYERRFHDSVEFKGQYFLATKKDCHPRKADVSFTTNEFTLPDNQFIEIESGKLLIHSSNCKQDGGTVYYRRVN